ncbi:MAG: hypothetical protein KAI73_04530 [Rhodospirillaceae bacterium]|nr:hypothetical protein [Rhodospirillaceae bacterium]
MGKISFVAKSGVSDAVLEQHREHSHRLGLPEVGFRPVATPLAVVGGGCSVSDNVKELQEFDGDIWAINGAFQWCLDNNIRATFYAVDPHEAVSEMCLDAYAAVVADSCHPRVFEELDGADIELARIGEGGIRNASTAASSAPMIAAHRGHTKVTFYGCESSYEGATHAYRNDMDKVNLVWVDCGGEEFITSPQMIMQAEFLSELTRKLPDYISVPGGGFLQSLIEHGEYSVTHISRKLDNALKGIAA